MICGKTEDVILMTSVETGAGVLMMNMMERANALLFWSFRASVMSVIVSVLHFYTIHRFVSQLFNHIKVHVSGW